nr:AAA family ATPase [Candidatus Sigynarchaeota archaeon]
MSEKKTEDKLARIGTNNTDVPWVEKYRPRTLKEVIGVDSKKESLVAFLKAFPAKHGAVLIGPPGVGKTTLAYVVARELSYDIIEMNASDARSSEDIKKKISESTKSRSITDFLGITKGKIILVDELDGISGNEDRGGVSTIVDLIKKTEYPIILTCNEWLSKLKAIYDECEMIKFTAVRKESVLKVLESILEKEGKKDLVTPGMLSKLAENAGGDFRSAINDLQTLVRGLLQNKKSNLARGGATDASEIIKSLKPTRDEFVSVFDGIAEALGSNRVSEARKALDKIDMPNVTSNFEWDTILQYLLQNFTKLTKNNQILAKGVNLFALADAFLGYVKQTQDWSMLAYFIDFISAAVAGINIDAKTAGFKQ